MKPRRKLPPGMIGNLVAPDRAYVPTSELGWLTPIRAARSGGGYWLFQCRCGESVSRLARNVRKSAEEGRTPRCQQSCSGVRVQHQEGPQLNG